MCIAHRFYNYNLSEYTLHDKNIEFLDYDLYVLGHDHVCYPNEEFKGKVIQRPGSLMRGTSHSYNLTREPSFDINYITESNGKLGIRFERVIIPHQPAIEVFSNQVFNKDSSKVVLDDISDQIDSLIMQMEGNTTSGSLYTIVDQVAMRPQVKNLIESYLTSMGVFREKEKE